MEAFLWVAVGFRDWGILMMVQATFFVVWGWSGLFVQGLLLRFILKALGEVGVLIAGEALGLVVASVWCRFSHARPWPSAVCFPCLIAQGCVIVRKILSGQAAFSPCMFPVFNLDSFRCSASQVCHLAIIVALSALGSIGDMRLGSPFL